MRIAALICVLLAVMGGLLSTLPLRWVGSSIFPDELQQQTKFGGTVWKGFASLPDSQGYADIKTRGLSALRGQPPIAFETRGAPFTASGYAGWKQISDVIISAPLQSLVKRDARLYGLSGDADVRLESLDLREGCEAAGAISVTNITMNYPGWNWRGPKMSGPISCEDNAMMFNLSGNQAGDDISLILKLSLAGAYDLQLSFLTRDAGADIALPLLGFDSKNGMWNLTERGQWR